MTASIHHVAREFEIDEGRYMVELIDAKGNVCHRATGDTREQCLLGLQRHGFAVDDNAKPNTEYREYLKSIEPKLV